MASISMMIRIIRMKIYRSTRTREQY